MRKSVKNSLENIWLFRSTASERLLQLVSSNFNIMIFLKRGTLCISKMIFPCNCENLYS